MTSVTAVSLSEVTDGELFPLLEEHWQEVGRHACPDGEFSFDRQVHQRMEDAGAWTAFCVREDGVLVGYAAFFISPHPFMDELTATLEVLYLRPSARRGIMAVMFLRQVFAELKARGIDAVHCGAPSVRDCGALFRRLGAREIETIWRKEL